jgi:glutathione peroxidase-family protein
VVCDPPADPNSIYAIADVSYDINQIDPVAMCKYRGEVMLVVNTAAL